MTFYLIGLGLNEKSISLEATEILKKCKKIYLENYTVDFPYKIEQLEKELNIKITQLDREQVENEKFLEQANQDISLLVYGDVLAATTHISLILACKKQNIKYKIIHNAGIFNAISETGLQMYKFGKTASMPSWTKTYTPDSFADIIKDNLKIKAHTLLLIDIGLDFEKAKEQLKTAAGNKKIFLDKIIICSKLGTSKQKIYYEKLDNLQNIEKPFCIIIPSTKLHEVEQEFLNKL